MGAETIALATLVGGTAAGVTNTIMAAEDQKSTAKKAKRAQAAEQALVAQRENEARLARTRRARRMGNAPSTLFGSLVGAPSAKLGGGA